MIRNGCDADTLTGPSHHLSLAAVREISVLAFSILLSIEIACLIEAAVQPPSVAAASSRLARSRDTAETTPESDPLCRCLSQHAYLGVEQLLLRCYTEELASQRNHAGAYAASRDQGILGAPETITRQ
jgi:hypothetical protein